MQRQGPVGRSLERYRGSGEEGGEPGWMLLHMRPLLKALVPGGGSGLDGTSRKVPL